MRDLLPALALTLIAFVFGYSASLAAPAEGEMAVVFPPFTTEQEVTPAIERPLAPLTRRWVQRGNERSLERLRAQAEGAVTPR